jgi:hypothetical protein
MVMFDLDQIQNFNFSLTIRTSAHLHIRTSAHPHICTLFCAFRKSNFQIRKPLKII